MASVTLGTNATNTLTAWMQNHAISEVDRGNFNNAIKNDKINGLPIFPRAFDDSILMIPNRGILKVLRGDYIAYDSQGWPILISANSIANGPWTHT